MDFWPIPQIILLVLLFVVFNVIKHLYFKRKHELLLAELQNTEYQICKSAEVELDLATGYSFKNYFYISDIIFIKNNIFILQKKLFTKQCCEIIQLSNDALRFRYKNAGLFYAFSNCQLISNTIRIETGKKSIAKVNLKVGIRLGKTVDTSTILERFDLNPINLN